MLRVHSSDCYAGVRDLIFQRALKDPRQTKLLKTAWEKRGVVYGYRKLHDDPSDVCKDIGPNRVWRLARLAGIQARIGYKNGQVLMAAVRLSWRIILCNGSLIVVLPPGFASRQLLTIGCRAPRQCRAALIAICHDKPCTLWRRKPKTKVQVPSGQAAQFTSFEWQQLLEQHNRFPDISRRGTCWQNAVVESFCKPLKRDRIRRKKYPPRKEARRDIFG